MNNDKLSMIIPVYNAEEYLTDCLQSILGQEDARLEVILINDGSSDGSDAVCRAFAGQHPDIIKYISIPNGGVSNARNLGLAEASGDWICFADGDDRLAPGALREIRQVLTPDTDVLCCSHIKDGEALGFTGKQSLLSPTDAVNFLFDHMGNTSRIEEYFTCRHMLFSPCWGKLYRREVIDSVRARFPSELKLSEDLLFNYQVFSRAKVIRTYDFPMYLYTINSRSATHSFSDGYIDDRLVLVDRLLELPPDERWDGAVRKHILTVILQLTGDISKASRKDSAKEKYLGLLRRPVIGDILDENRRALLSDGAVQQKYYRTLVRLLGAGRYNTALLLGSLYTKLTQHR